jgi:hypothetical protein
MGQLVLTSVSLNAPRSLALEAHTIQPLHKISRRKPLGAALIVHHLGTQQGRAGQEQRLPKPFEIVGEGSAFVEQEAVLKGSARAGVAWGYGDDELFHCGDLILSDEIAYTLSTPEKMSRLTQRPLGAVC